MRSVIIALLALGAAGCATAPVQPKVSPTVIVACPPLTPLADDTFGSTVNKLAEVASTYNECRKAIGLE